MNDREADLRRPGWKRSLYMTRFAYWPDDHERIIVLHAYFEKHGWTNAHADNAWLKRQATEARAALEQASRLEDVLERYRKLCEGSDEGEPAAPSGSDDEIPL